MQERQIDLSAQVARVKRRTRPWKSIIALVLAIAAAVISHRASHGSSTFLHTSDLTNQFVAYGTAAVVPRFRVHGDLRPGREVEEAARAEGRPGAFRHRPVRDLGRRRVHDAGDHARAVRRPRQPAPGRRGARHRLRQHRGAAGTRQRVRRAGAGLRPALQGGRPDPAARRCAGRDARRRRGRYRDHLHALRHRRQRDVHPELAGAERGRWALFPRTTRTTAKPPRPPPSSTASRALRGAPSNRSRRRRDRPKRVPKPRSRP